MEKETLAFSEVDINATVFLWYCHDCDNHQTSTRHHAPRFKNLASAISDSLQKARPGLTCVTDAEVVAAEISSAIIANRLEITQKTFPFSQTSPLYRQVVGPSSQPSPPDRHPSVRRISSRRRRFVVSRDGKDPPKSNIADILENSPEVEPRTPNHSPTPHYPVSPISTNANPSPLPRVYGGCPCEEASSINPFQPRFGCFEVYVRSKSSGAVVEYSYLCVYSKLATNKWPKKSQVVTAVLSRLDPTSTLQCQSGTNSRHPSGGPSQDERSPCLPEPVTTLGLQYSEDEQGWHGVGDYLYNYFPPSRSYTLLDNAIPLLRQYAQAYSTIEEGPNEGKRTRFLNHIRFLTHVVTHLPFIVDYVDRHGVANSVKEYMSVANLNERLSSVYSFLVTHWRVIGDTGINETAESVILQTQTQSQSHGTPITGTLTGNGPQLPSRIFVSDYAEFEGEKGPIIPGATADGRGDNRLKNLERWDKGPRFSMAFIRLARQFGLKSLLDDEDRFTALTKAADAVVAELNYLQKSALNSDLGHVMLMATKANILIEQFETTERYGVLSVAPSKVTQRTESLVRTLKQARGRARLSNLLGSQDSVAEDVFLRLGANDPMVLRNLVKSCSSHPNLRSVYISMTLRGPENGDKREMLVFAKFLSSKIASVARVDESLVTLMSLVSYKQHYQIMIEIYLEHLEIVSNSERQIIREGLADPRNWSEPRLVPPLKVELLSEPPTFVTFLLFRSPVVMSMPTHRLCEEVIEGLRPITLKHIVQVTQVDRHADQVVLTFTASRAANATCVAVLERSPKVGEFLRRHVVSAWSSTGGDTGHVPGVERRASIYLNANVTEFHEERRALKEMVWPAVNSLAKELGVQFDTLDLWSSAMAPHMTGRPSRTVSILRAIDSYCTLRSRSIAPMENIHPSDFGDQSSAFSAKPFCLTLLGYQNGPTPCTVSPTKPSHEMPSMCWNCQQPFDYHKHRACLCVEKDSFCAKCGISSARHCRTFISPPSQICWSSFPSRTKARAIKSGEIENSTVKYPTGYCIRCGESYERHSLCDHAWKIQNQDHNRDSSVQSQSISPKCPLSNDGARVFSQTLGTGTPTSRSSVSQTTRKTEFNHQCRDHDFDPGGELEHAATSAQFPWVSDSCYANHSIVHLIMDRTLHRSKFCNESFVFFRNLGAVIDKDIQGKVPSFAMKTLLRTNKHTMRIREKMESNSNCSHRLQSYTACVRGYQYPSLSIAQAHLQSLQTTDSDRDMLLKLHSDRILAAANAEIDLTPHQIDEWERHLSRGHLLGELSTYGVRIGMLSKFIVRTASLVYDSLRRHFPSFRTYSGAIPDHSADKLFQRQRMAALTSYGLPSPEFCLNDILNAMKPTSQSNTKRLDLNPMVMVTAPSGMGKTKAFASLAHNIECDRALFLLTYCWGCGGDAVSKFMRFIFSECLSGVRALRVACLDTEKTSNVSDTEWEVKWVELYSSEPTHCLSRLLSKFCRLLQKHGRALVLLVDGVDDDKSLALLRKLSCGLVESGGKLVVFTCRKSVGQSASVSAQTDSENKDSGGATVPIGLPVVVSLPDWEDSDSWRLQVVDYWMRAFGAECDVADIAPTLASVEGTSCPLYLYLAAREMSLSLDFKLPQHMLKFLPRSLPLLWSQFVIPRLCLQYTACGVVAVLNMLIESGSAVVSYAKLKSSISSTNEGLDDSVLFPLAMELRTMFQPETTASRGKEQDCMFEILLPEAVRDATRSTLTSEILQRRLKKYKFWLLEGAHEEIPGPIEEESDEEYDEEYVKYLLRKVVEGTDLEHADRHHYVLTQLSAALKKRAVQLLEDLQVNTPSSTRKLKMFNKLLEEAVERNVDVDHSGSDDQCVDVDPLLATSDTIRVYVEGCRDPICLLPKSFGDKSVYETRKALMQRLGVPATEMKPPSSVQRHGAESGGESRNGKDSVAHSVDHSSAVDDLSFSASIPTKDRNDTFADENILFMVRGIPFPRDSEELTKTNELFHSYLVPMSCEGPGKNVYHKFLNSSAFTYNFSEFTETLQWPSGAGRPLCCSQLRSVLSPILIIGPQGCSSINESLQSVVSRGWVLPPLLDAVTHDDEKSVSRLVNDGGCDVVGTKDWRGWTAMHYAFWRGNHRMVKLLVELATYRIPKQVLLDTSLAGHESIGDDTTDTRVAGAQTSTAAISRAISYKAAQRELSNTTVPMACRDVLTSALFNAQTGISHFANPSGPTPVHVGICNRRTSVVVEALTSGLINTDVVALLRTHLYPTTPLESGPVEVIIRITLEALGRPSCPLAFPSSLIIRPIDGTVEISPVFEALRHIARYDTTAQLMAEIIRRRPTVRSGQVLEISDNGLGRTILLEAVYWGNFELVKLLSRQTIVVEDQLDNFGRNSLHIALDLGRWAISLYLARLFPAMKSHKDSRGRLPLHCLFWFSSANSRTDRCLRRGEMVSDQDAYCFPNPGLMKELLLALATREAAVTTDSHGISPLSACVSCGDIQLLLQFYKVCSALGAQYDADGDEVDKQSWDEDIFDLADSGAFDSLVDLRSSSKPRVLTRADEIQATLQIYRRRPPKICYPRCFNVFVTRQSLNIQELVHETCESHQLLIAVATGAKTGQGMMEWLFKRSRLSTLVSCNESPVGGAGLASTQTLAACVMRGMINNGWTDQGVDGIVERLCQYPDAVREGLDWCLIRNTDNQSFNSGREYDLEPQYLSHSRDERLLLQQVKRADSVSIGMEPTSTRSRENLESLLVEDQVLRKPELRHQLIKEEDGRIKDMVRELRKIDDRDILLYDESSRRRYESDVLSSGGKSTLRRLGEALCHSELNRLEAERENMATYSRERSRRLKFASSIINAASRADTLHPALCGRTCYSEANERCHGVSVGSMKSPITESIKRMVEDKRLEEFMCLTNTTAAWNICGPEHSHGSPLWRILFGLLRKPSSEELASNTLLAIRSLVELWNTSHILDNDTRWEVLFGRVEPLCLQTDEGWVSSAAEALIHLLLLHRPMLLVTSPHGLPLLSLLITNGARLKPSGFELRLEVSLWQDRFRSFDHNDTKGCSSALEPNLRNPALIREVCTKVPNIGNLLYSICTSGSDISSIRMAALCSAVSSDIDTLATILSHHRQSLTWNDGDISIMGCGGEEVVRCLQQYGFEIGRSDIDDTRSLVDYCNLLSWSSFSGSAEFYRLRQCCIHRENVASGCAYCEIYSNMLSLGLARYRCLSSDPALDIFKRSLCLHSSSSYASASILRKWSSLWMEVTEENASEILRRIVNNAVFDIPDVALERLCAYPLAVREGLEWLFIRSKSSMYCKTLESSKRVSPMRKSEFLEFSARLMDISARLGHIHRVLCGLCCKDVSGVIDGTTGTWDAGCDMFWRVMAVGNFRSARLITQYWTRCERSNFSHFNPMINCDRCKNCSGDELRSLCGLERKIEITEWHRATCGSLKCLSCMLDSVISKVCPSPRLVAATLNICKEMNDCEASYHSYFNSSVVEKVLRYVVQFSTSRCLRSTAGCRQLLGLLLQGVAANPRRPKACASVLSRLSTVGLSEVRHVAALMGSSTISALIGIFEEEETEAESNVSVVSARRKGWLWLSKVAAASNDMHGVKLSLSCLTKSQRRLPKSLTLDFHILSLVTLNDECLSVLCKGGYLAFNRKNAARVWLFDSLKRHRATGHRQQEGDKLFLSELLSVKFLKLLRLEPKDTIDLLPLARTRNDVARLWDLGLSRFSQVSEFQESERDYLRVGVQKCMWMGMAFALDFILERDSRIMQRLGPHVSVYNSLSVPHLAVLSRSRRCLELTLGLISGSLSQCCDDSNWNPFDYAVLLGDVEMITILLLHDPFLILRSDSQDPTSLLSISPPGLLSVAVKSAGGREGGMTSYPTTVNESMTLLKPIRKCVGEARANEAANALVSLCLLHQRYPSISLPLILSLADEEAAVHVGCVRALEGDHGGIYGDCNGDISALAVSSSNGEFLQIVLLESLQFAIQQHEHHTEHSAFSTRLKSRLSTSNLVGNTSESAFVMGINSDVAAKTWFSLLLQHGTWEGDLSNIPHRLLSTSIFPDLMKEIVSFLVRNDHYHSLSVALDVAVVEGAKWFFDELSLDREWLSVCQWLWEMGVYVKPFAPQSSMLIPKETNLTTEEILDETLVANSRGEEDTHRRCVKFWRCDPQPYEFHILSDGSHFYCIANALKEEMLFDRQRAHSWERSSFLRQAINNSRVTQSDGSVRDRSHDDSSSPQILERTRMRYNQAESLDPSELSKRWMSSQRYDHIVEALTMQGTMSQFGILLLTRGKSKNRDSFVEYQCNGRRDKSLSTVSKIVVQWLERPELLAAVLRCATALKYLCFDEPCHPGAIATVAPSLVVGSLVHLLLPESAHHCLDDFATSLEGIESVTITPTKTMDGTNQHSPAFAKERKKTGMAFLHGLSLLPMLRSLSLPTTKRSIAGSTGLAENVLLCQNLGILSSDLAYLLVTRQIQLHELCGYSISGVWNGEKHIDLTEALVFNSNRESGADRSQSAILMPMLSGGRGVRKLNEENNIDVMSLSLCHACMELDHMLDSERVIETATMPDIGQWWNSDQGAPISTLCTLERMWKRLNYELPSLMHIEIVPMPRSTALGNTTRNALLPYNGRKGLDQHCWQPFGLFDSSFPDDIENSFIYNTWKLRDHPPTKAKRLEWSNDTSIIRAGANEDDEGHVFEQKSETDQDIQLLEENPSLASRKVFTSLARKLKTRSILKSMDASFHFTVRGVFTDTWMVDVRDSSVCVLCSPDNRTVDAKVTLSDADMMALFSGSLNMREAISESVVTFDGPDQMIDKLDDLLFALRKSDSWSGGHNRITLASACRQRETIRPTMSLLEGNSVNLFHPPLMVVGSSCAGKTSLIRALASESNRAPSIHVDERTIGIEMTNVTLTCKRRSGEASVEGKATDQLKVWDFAGEGHYISTHVFFLLKKSLYLLVFRLSQTVSLLPESTSREDICAQCGCPLKDGSNGDEPAEVLKTRHGYCHVECNPEIEAVTQWIERLRARAPGSTVLLVANDVSEHPSISADVQLSQVVDAARSANRHLNRKDDRSKSRKSRESAVANVTILPKVFSVNCLRGHNIISLRSYLSNFFLRNYSAHLDSRGSSGEMDGLRSVAETVLDWVVRTRGSTGCVPWKTFADQIYRLSHESAFDVDVCRQVATLLHQSGHVFWLEDHQSLSQLVFINPKWLATTVSSVICHDHTRVVAKSPSVQPLLRLLTREGVLHASLHKFLWPSMSESGISSILELLRRFAVLVSESGGGPRMLDPKDNMENCNSIVPGLLVSSHSVQWDASLLHSLKTNRAKLVFITSFLPEGFWERLVIRCRRVSNTLSIRGPLAVFHIRGKESYLFLSKISERDDQVSSDSCNNEVGMILNSIHRRRSCGNVKDVRDGDDIFFVLSLFCPDMLHLQLLADQIEAAIDEEIGESLLEGVYVPCPSCLDRSDDLGKGADRFMFDWKDVRKLSSPNFVDEFQSSGKSIENLTCKIEELTIPLERVAPTHLPDIAVIRSDGEWARNLSRIIEASFRAMNVLVVRASLREQEILKHIPLFLVVMEGQSEQEEEKDREERPERPERQERETMNESRELVKYVSSLPGISIIPIVAGSYSPQFPKWWPKGMEQLSKYLFVDIPNIPETPSEHNAPIQADNTESLRDLIFQADKLLSRDPLLEGEGTGSCISTILCPSCEEYAFPLASIERELADGDVRQRSEFEGAAEGRCVQVACPIENIGVSIHLPSKSSARPTGGAKGVACPSCMKHKLVPPNIFWRDDVIAHEREILLRLANGEQGVSRTEYCEKERKEIPLHEILKPEVFLSYSWGYQRRTQEHVKELKRTVEAETGLSCWLDIEKMAGGQVFDDEMNWGVRHAGCVVVCIDKNYVKSDNCLKEYYFAAVKFEKPVVVCIVEDENGWDATISGLTPSKVWVDTWGEEAHKKMNSHFEDAFLRGIRIPVSSSHGGEHNPNGTIRSFVSSIKSKFSSLPEPSKMSTRKTMENIMQKL